MSLLARGITREMKVEMRNEQLRLAYQMVDEWNYHRRESDGLTLARLVIALQTEQEIRS